MGGQQSASIEGSCAGETCTVSGKSGICCMTDSEAFCTDCAGIFENDDTCGCQLAMINISCGCKVSLIGYIVLAVIALCIIIPAVMCIWQCLRDCFCPKKHVVVVRRTASQTPDVYP
eukprot:45962_1